MAVKTRIIQSPVARKQLTVLVAGGRLRSTRVSYDVRIAEAGARPFGLVVPVRWDVETLVFDGRPLPEGPLGQQPAPSHQSQKSYGKCGTHEDSNRFQRSTAPTGLTCLWLQGPQWQYEPIIYCSYFVCRVGVPDLRSDRRS